MRKTFNSYTDFYSTLETFDTVGCPTISFFINSIKNTEGCDCTEPKKAALARYKNLTRELLPNEKVKLLNFFHVEEIELKDDNWSEIIL